MSMLSKLQRMKKHIVRDEPAAFIPEVPETLRCWQQWQQAGAELFEAEGQHCLVRETKYPLDYRHGLYSFREAADVIGKWQQFSGDHPLSAKGFDPSDLFFFDIETTGLSGAGSVIFLLGTARISGDAVTVKQFVLPAPGNETALYTKFLKETDYTTLVTYNGKAFDWPQVQSRHLLVRNYVPPLPSFGHFDLYHASKRLFKHTVESVKLVNVEAAHLGIKRENDVPGHLAPIIYFDFLERGDPEGILEVMKHNERDILSLITLYTHISRLVLEEQSGEDERTALEVARWFNNSGNHAAAEKALGYSVQSSDEEVAAEAAYHLAMQYKRAGRFKETEPLFKQSLQPGRKHALQAATELAKLYEHRQKDPSKALSCTEWALSQTKDEQKRSLLLHRQARLQRKQKSLPKNNPAYCKFSEKNVK